MKCPNCGLQTIDAQKFCRSCGTNLQLTTQPLSDVGLSPRSSPEIIPKTERSTPNALVLRGFIVMFMGVALGVVGEKLVHADSVTVVGILLSLLGMFMTAFPYLLPTSSRRSDSRSPSEPKTLGSAPAPKSLPHDREIEYVSSVTERTTDLLEGVESQTPRRNANGESPR